MTDELREYQAEQYRRRHPIPSAQGRTRRRPVPGVPPQPVRQRVRRPLPKGWRLYATPIVLGVIGCTACVIGIVGNSHHVPVSDQAYTEAPSCAEGQVLTSINADGAFTCKPAYERTPSSSVGDRDIQVLTNKTLQGRFSQEVVLTHELNALVPHSFSSVSDPVVLYYAQEPLQCEVKAVLVWPPFRAVHGVVNLYLLRSVADVYEDSLQAGLGRRADVIVPPSPADSLTVYTERVPCPQSRFRVLVKNDTDEPMAAGGSVITVRVVGAE